MVRLAAGGVAEHGTRLITAETTLEGALLESADIATAARTAQASISPLGDERGSADYRRAILGVLLARVLNGALVSLRSVSQA